MNITETLSKSSISVVSTTASIVKQCKNTHFGLKFAGGCLSLNFPAIVNVALASDNAVAEIEFAWSCQVTSSWHPSLPSPLSPTTTISFSPLSPSVLVPVRNYTTQPPSVITSCYERGKMSSDVGSRESQGMRVGLGEASRHAH